MSYGEAVVNYSKSGCNMLYQAALKNPRTAAMAVVAGGVVGVFAKKYPDQFNACTDAVWKLTKFTFESINLYASIGAPLIGSWALIEGGRKRSLELAVFSAANFALFGLKSVLTGKR